MPPARKTPRAKPKPSTLDFGTKSSTLTSKTKPLSQVSVPVGVSAGKKKQIASVTALDNQLWVDKYQPDTRVRLLLPLQLDCALTVRRMN